MLEIVEKMYKLQTRDNGTVADVCPQIPRGGDPLRNQTETAQIQEVVGRKDPRGLTPGDNLIAAQMPGAEGLVIGPPWNGLGIVLLRIAAQTLGI